MPNFTIWGAVLSLALLQTSFASAAVFTIDDGADTITATTDPTVPTESIDITQEAVGVLGDVSIHYEYISTDPNIPGPGATATFNVNLLEPGGGISDTLGITLTGHVTPTSNVSVDLSFLSDSLDEIPPAALLPGTLNPGGLNVLETGDFQTFSVLSDLTVNVRSDVEPAPEPASLALLGSGLAAFGLFRRRRRRSA